MDFAHVPCLPLVNVDEAAADAKYQKFCSEVDVLEMVQKGLMSRDFLHACFSMMFHVVSYSRLHILQTCFLWALIRQVSRRCVQRMDGSDPRR